MAVTPGPRPAGTGLAASIAAVPGLTGRLLDQHSDDGHGRCRTCTRAHQGGREAWPCRIRSYAEVAAELLDAAHPS